LDPITLFYTGVVVGIYCWKKAKQKVKEGDLMGWFVAGFITGVAIAVVAESYETGWVVAQCWD